MDSDDGSGRKRVLLTGATGFVGRQIHRALLAEGHEVRPVIRTGSTGRLIPDADTDVVHETPDLFSEPQDWWAARCQGIDTVVHAAWFVNPATYLSAPQNLDCLRGSLALARGAVDAGVGHIVGIGTCLEYRLPSDRLSVDAPLAPTTLYAHAKLALFNTLASWLGSTGTRFSWARLFYLYGADEHPSRLVPYVLAGLSAGRPIQLSAGTQLRDYLDVRHAGAMIARTVSTGQVGAINICSSRPITVRQLAEELADACGRRDLLQFGTAPPRPSDPAAVVGICNLQSPPTIDEAFSR
jgi:nucleoside-diphosphate-sugar epimerase